MIKHINFFTLKSLNLYLYLPVLLNKHCECEFSFVRRGINGVSGMIVQYRAVVEFDPETEFVRTVSRDCSAAKVSPDKTISATPT